MPPTYVFEDLRGVLLDHVLRADLMLTGLAINSLLFAATAVGFARLLASARRAGTFERASMANPAGESNDGVLSVRPKRS